MRFFNTAGPIKPEDHHHISPLERIDRDEMFGLIGQKRYFVLHAPRQTGKTSALVALRDELNTSGQYRAVYVNVEPAQAAREDVHSAVQTILSQLASEARFGLEDSFVDEVWPQILSRSGGYDALREVLKQWSVAGPLPLVLMIDEIDALVGDSLVSVLRQLRSGYIDRPERFPQTVILCGVRDVRDYRIHSGTEKMVIAGGSAFNIKAESLRLGDFDEGETHALLGQHTDDTGQAWSGEALAEVWRSTQGQPWLVNALAAQALKAVPDRGQTIEADDIMSAREVLIRRRDTHLDQLGDKLREDRIRRVIGPLLSSEPTAKELDTDDVQYVRDLGLIKRQPPVKIANPIYREIIPRELLNAHDEFLPFETEWFVENGRLVMECLMDAFQKFFREHSEHWMERFDFREAGPQLLLQAFLQRVVNAGGRVEREYGIGRGRTDLLVVWGRGSGMQKAVIECKLRRNGLERTVQKGLEQISKYMDGCSTDEGHLVIFDRSEKRTWKEKIFRRGETVEGRCVTVWGM
ncbi:MAG: AAA family ATPase [Gammaproteobacteria bacterium]|nr:AAA family ATPase [Gammaproteobacteria bacterium]MYI89350.1 AAA family ATPase [Gammaproteobacteria bacterium]